MRPSREPKEEQPYNREKLPGLEISEDRAVPGLRKTPWIDIPVSWAEHSSPLHCSSPGIIFSAASTWALVFVSSSELLKRGSRNICIQLTLSSWGSVVENADS